MLPLPIWCINSLILTIDTPFPINLISYEYSDCAITIQDPFLQILTRVLMLFQSMWLLNTSLMCIRKIFLGKTCSCVWLGGIAKISKCGVLLGYQIHTDNLFPKITVVGVLVEGNTSKYDLRELISIFTRDYSSRNQALVIWHIETSTATCFFDA